MSLLFYTLKTADPAAWVRLEKLCLKALISVSSCVPLRNDYIGFFPASLDCGGFISEGKKNREELIISQHCLSHRYYSINTGILNNLGASCAAPLHSTEVFLSVTSPTHRLKPLVFQALNKDVKRLPVEVHQFRAVAH